LIDPETQVLPLAGSRDGLFQVVQVLLGVSPDGPPPLVLLPNPFYQVYAGAVLLAGAQPVFVPADASTGFLPDFAALPEETLRRSRLAFLCSPANPQGAVADLDRLCAVISLARRYGFVLAADECYSEIYDRDPPPGALEACERLGEGTAGVLVFHSLSKRSSVPGLRSGFVAGDRTLIDAFRRFRSYAGTALALPVLAASTALWRDETHVADSRALYRAKMEMAERHLNGRLGFYRPAGAFFPAPIWRGPMSAGSIPAGPTSGSPWSRIWTPPPTPWRASPTFCWRPDGSQGRQSTQGCRTVSSGRRRRHAEAVVAAGLRSGGGRHRPGAGGGIGDLRPPRPQP
jgi:N-succinyldiaminopimelate aminotransferase